MTNKKKQWYDVDRQGLRKLLESKPKCFILYELIQNGWDQKTEYVHVSTRFSDVKAYIEVVDGDPNGFQDLSHAYTLFAESMKKSDPTKRGRFNVGEKIVLAFCESAEIYSTKGGVIERV